MRNSLRHIIDNCECRHVSIWREATDELDAILRVLDEALRRVEALEAVEKAARTLGDFLWNEKETFEPPRELREQGYVALETSKDYDREEQLVEALRAALAADQGSGEPFPYEGYDRLPPADQGSEKPRVRKTVIGLPPEVADQGSEE